MYTIILLAVGVLLQALVLALLLRHQRQFPMGQVTGASQSKALRRVLSIQGKLTSIQWNVGMVLNGDTGKPNIAQQQFLHQAIKDCKIAVKDLDAALKEFGCAPTSKNIQKST